MHSRSQVRVSVSSRHTVLLFNFLLLINLIKQILVIDGFVLFKKEYTVPSYNVQN